MHDNIAIQNHFAIIRFPRECLILPDDIVLYFRGKNKPYMRRSEDNGKHIFQHFQL
jgi:hypothetical protein